MANFYKPKAPVKTSSKTKQRLQISAVDHLGRGICNDLDKITFVQGALPGEVVDAEVLSGKGSVNQANVLKVIEPNASRRQPFCRHFEVCGGCETQYADETAMLDFKQHAIESLVLHTPTETASNKPAKKGRLSGRRTTNSKPKTLKDVIGNLPWQQAIRSEGQHYRHKTRLAVDARNPNDLKLGYRARGSKDVFNLQTCPILVSELTDLIAPIQTVFQQLKQPNKIGHVSMVKGDNRVLISIRVVKTLASEDMQLLSDFADKHALVIDLETDKAGSTISALSDTIQYSPADSISLDMQINDFVQVNGAVNQQMIEQAKAWLAISEEDVVLDLFCGIGNFSLPMATSCKHVYGIEGVAKMVQRAQQNAQNNNLSNCHFVEADLNEPQSLAAVTHYKCNKVILDPSREGARETVNALPKLGPSHILYVSCNPATFSRDAAGLLKQNYQLVKIGLMDMFPNTTHTELMALFMRSDYSTDINGD